MTILRGIIGLILTICIAGFAVLNRAQVSIVWNPIDLMAVTIPVYLVALISLSVGFIIGGVMVWLNMGGVRKARRKQKREIKILEKEVGRLKEDKFTASTPPASDLFPALPAK